MQKILIIEDNKILREYIKESLNLKYIVNIIEDFSNIVEGINSFEFDVVLLDLTLPDIYGADLINILKVKNSNCKIIVTTSDESINSEISLFKFGVDDYIKKPLDMEVLKLRINKLLETNKSNLKYGDININIDKMLLNETIKLTKNDLIILSYLVKNNNIIIDYNKVLKQLWENDEFVEKTALNMALTRLRKKLKQANIKNEIQTIRSKGVILK